MTREGTILGTYPYMSPEQAEGKPVDGRSDLFSFGVMLYEMACGMRPFQGETGIAQLMAILRDDQPPLAEVRPELPARLGEIVDRCLEKSPDARYGAAEELRDDLEELRREVARGAAVSGIAVSGTAASSPLRPAAATLAPPRPAVIKPQGRRGVWVAAAAVLAALGIAIWGLRPEEVAAQSLAVLPFENTLEDEDTEYLCDGVAESLIRQVSTLPSVRVTPLTAALNFKGKRVDPGEAGRQLGVDTVLAGTLSLEGERLRITAELVDVDSGAELWSNTYDREVVDLLNVQDEIADAILDDGLRLRLAGDERRELVRNPTADGEAYDLYLQARYLQRRATEDDYLEARELLQRAIIRDPEFALAYGWLAGTHMMMVVDGLERPTDGWPQSNRYLRQAAAIDPNLVSLRALTHGHAFFFDWDWEGAKRERERAMQSVVGELDPDLIRTFALERWALGRPGEALALARRARELDPLSIGLAMLEADYLVYAGQPDAALALYERTIEGEPDNPEPYFGLAEALVQQGRFDEAIEARRQAHTVAGDTELAARFATARGTEGYRQVDRAYVRLQLEWLEARAGWGYVSPLDLARAHAQLGDAEEAFRYLEAAFVDRSAGLVFLNSDRVWDSIRDDPRFLDAVRRVGLPSPI